MVTKQLDALTLEFLSIREIEVSHALNNVLDILHLGDLWDEFCFVGRDRWFESVYRHNDISILLCREGKLREQGICIRMTGNGLAFYVSYLERKGLKLRNVCRSWRASAVNGDFTRCTRIDVAIDDIHTNGETPLLTMRKIRNCVKRREFRSRLMANRPLYKQLMEVTEDFSSKNDETQGDTIYFGKRKNSPILCRFYDKLSEQRSRSLPVEDDVTSWVRCEFEFKQSKAAAVFNNYCDMDDDEFCREISANFNNYVCFIVKDDCNRSRCSVKRWWIKFLGTAEKSRLISPQYKPSTFRGVMEWIENISPSLYVLARTVGLRYCIDFIIKCGKNRLSSRHKQFTKDFLQQFVHQTKLSDTVSSEKSCENLGLDYWVMTSKKSKYQAMKDIQEDYKRFRTVNGLDWKEFPDRTEYKAKQLRIAEASEAFERDMFELMGV